MADILVIVSFATFVSCLFIFAYVPGTKKN